MKTIRKIETITIGKRLRHFFLIFLLSIFLIPLLSQANAAIVYDAAEYFVAPQMWDNSGRLQALVDKVHAEGGGTIQLGTGEYIFRSTVKWRSKVCLQGVSVQAPCSRWLAPPTGRFSLARAQSKATSLPSRACASNISRSMPTR